MLILRWNGKFIVGHRWPTGRETALKERLISLRITRYARMLHYGRHVSRRMSYTIRNRGEEIAAIYLSSYSQRTTFSLLSTQIARNTRTKLLATQYRPRSTGRFLQIIRIRVACVSCLLLLRSSRSRVYPKRRIIACGCIFKENYPPSQRATAFGARDDAFRLYIPLSSLLSRDRNL